MVTGNDNFPKRFRKMMTSINASLIALGVMLIVGGCGAGPAKKPGDQDIFEQWLQKDSELYAGRNIDWQKTIKPYQLTDPDQALPENATFDDYVKYAILSNPELEAAFYRWRAALERVPQVRGLPDPRFSFGIVLDQVDDSAEYMGERYSISQIFPWFGKLKIRGDIALEEAQAESQRFEAIRLQLIDQLSQAYFEYDYLHQAIAIARENLQLLIQMESVARAMYRAGSVTLSDVNRAQVEIGRIEDQVRSFEDMLGASAGELNALMGRNAHAYLPAVTGLSSAKKSFELDDYSDDQWISFAKEGNPDLAARRFDAARQRHAVELAKKDYFPDFELGVEYARDSSARMASMDGGGADMLSLILSINLPIWREKYDAGTREMTARAAEATRQIKSREDKLEAELKRALFDYRDSLRKAGLYGGTLLLKARQSLAATEAAYRAGESGFSDLIDAQRVMLEFALAHERALTDFARASIKVQTLVGHGTTVVGQ